jgi:phytoene dehydrogenase-like protein
MWGYVEGGMGMISFILCDIARDAGATVLTGLPVAKIIPGTGVELAGGEKVSAGVVVSNADPRMTLSLLGDAADPRWRERVLAVPQTGCNPALGKPLTRPSASTEPWGQGRSSRS